MIVTTVTLPAAACARAVPEAVNDQRDRRHANRQEALQRHSVFSYRGQSQPPQKLIA